MLTRKTYTNTAPAEAAILPGVADHLRRQVLVELVRLSGMLCSMQKASGTAGASVSKGVSNRADNWVLSKESLCQFERGPQRTSAKPPRI